jgi:pimeloyl-ACP methyl ester carboxylesterase
MNTTVERFSRVISSEGAARGLQVTGKLSVSARQNQEDLPVIVALHGGGYTSDYFDIPGASLLERASALDIPIIALDRPGYGGTSRPPADRAEASVFATNAQLIQHMIGELVAEYAPTSRGVVVVGHSIGAQVALQLASRPRDWPLLGLAVSGCLLRSPSRFAGIWESTTERVLDSPIEQKGERMMGPSWTRLPGMPLAAAFASVPVLTEELRQSATTWTNEYLGFAGRIDVPVHVRVGEFDTLWVADDEQLAELTGALSGAPSVDAAFTPAAGHAIDLHRIGRAFQLEQLAFAAGCAAGRSGGPPSDGTR